MTIRKLIALRYLFFWLYVSFSLGVPIILVSLKYDLVSSVTPTPYKATAMGMIMAMVAVFYFREQFKEMLNNMDDGITKTLCKEIVRVIPILLLYFALRFAEIHMRNFQFITIWAFVSNLVAVWFRVMQLEYIRRIKVMKNGKN